jgi:hypothetical protein
MQGGPPPSLLLLRWLPLLLQLCIKQGSVSA